MQNTSRILNFFDPVPLMTGVSGQTPLELASTGRNDPAVILALLTNMEANASVCFGGGVPPLPSRGLQPPPEGVAPPQQIARTIQRLPGRMITAPGADDNAIFDRLFILATSKGTSVVAGQTVSHALVQDGSMDALLRLVDRHTEAQFDASLLSQHINDVDDLQRSALDLAVAPKTASVAIAKLLLQHGAKLNSTWIDNLPISPDCASVIAGSMQTDVADNVFETDVTHRIRVPQQWLEGGELQISDGSVPDQRTADVLCRFLQTATCSTTAIAIDSNRAADQTVSILLKSLSGGLKNNHPWRPCVSAPADFHPLPGRISFLTSPWAMIPASDSHSSLLMSARAFPTRQSQWSIRPKRDQASQFKCHWIRGRSCTSNLSRPLRRR